MIPAVVASVIVFIAIFAVAYFFLVIRRRRNSSDSSHKADDLFRGNDGFAKHFDSGIELEIRNTKIYDDRLKYDGKNQTTVTSSKKNFDEKKIVFENSPMKFDVGTMNNPGFGKVKVMKIEKTESSSSILPSVMSLSSSCNSNSNNNDKNSLRPAGASSVFSETYGVPDPIAESYMNMVNPTHIQASLSGAVASVNTNANSNASAADQYTSKLSVTFHSKYLAYDDSAVVIATDAWNEEVAIDSENIDILVNPMRET